MRPQLRRILPFKIVSKEKVYLGNGYTAGGGKM
jgi:hypothetical protein